MYPYPNFSKRAISAYLYHTCIPYPNPCFLAYKPKHQIDHRSEYKRAKVLTVNPANGAIAITTPSLECKGCFSASSIFPHTPFATGIIYISLIPSLENAILQGIPEPERILPMRGKKHNHKKQLNGQNKFNMMETNLKLLLTQNLLMKDLKQFFFPN